MNTDHSPDRNDDLRPGYDETVLKAGERGKYADRYANGTNLVRLEADVAARFQSDVSVNEALRLLIRLTDEARKVQEL